MSLFSAPPVAQLPTFKNSVPIVGRAAAGQPLAYFNFPAIADNPYNKAALTSWKFTTNNGSVPTRLQWFISHTTQPMTLGFRSLPVPMEADEIPLVASNLAGDWNSDQGVAVAGVPVLAQLFYDSGLLNPGVSDQPFSPPREQFEKPPILTAGVNQIYVIAPLGILVGVPWTLNVTWVLSP